MKIPLEDAAEYRGHDGEGSRESPNRTESGRDQSNCAEFTEKLGREVWELNILLSFRPCPGNIPTPLSF
jgi:hypothetical protein